MSKHLRSDSANSGDQARAMPMSFGALAGTRNSIRPFELDQVPLASPAYVGLNIVVSYERGHMPRFNSMGGRTVAAHGQREIRAWGERHRRAIAPNEPLVKYIEEIQAK